MHAEEDNEGDNSDHGHRHRRDTTTEDQLGRMEIRFREWNSQLDVLRQDVTSIRTRQQELGAAMTDDLARRITFEDEMRAHHDAAQRRDEILMEMMTRLEAQQMSQSISRSPRSPPY